MTWVDVFIKGASDKYIKSEYERRGFLVSTTLQPAIIYGEISDSELSDILPSKFIIDGNEYWTHGYIRDEKYKLTSIVQIKKFLTWNKTSNADYIAEYYDCDNFSLQLAADAQVWTPGLAFGIMDVPGHSKNICVTNDHKVWEIEPQSDAVNELKPITQVTLYLI